MGDSLKWVKAIDGERKKERRRPKVGNNNVQLRNATPPQKAHAKPPEPIQLIDCPIYN